MLNMEGNVARPRRQRISVKDGALTTLPQARGRCQALRAAVMDIAKEKALQCRQSVTTLYDVYNADEAFLTGTAAEVIPWCVVTADYRQRKTRPNYRADYCRFRKLTLLDGVRV